MTTHPRTVTVAVACGILSILISLSAPQLAGCGATPPPLKTIGANVVACSKAEATAIESGTSIIDLVNLVNSAIDAVKASGLAGLEAEIGKLIQTYGEPIIACVVVKGISAAQRPSSSAPEKRILAAPDSPTAARIELAIIHQWQIKD